MPYFNRDKNGKISGGLFFSPQYEKQEGKPDDDPEVIAFLAAANSVTAKEEIKQQLAEIDTRKVRAISDAILSADNKRLQALENEAAALRAKLLAQV